MHVCMQNNVDRSRKDTRSDIKFRDWIFLISLSISQKLLPNYGLLDQTIKQWGQSQNISTFVSRTNHSPKGWPHQASSSMSFLLAESLANHSIFLKYDKTSCQNNFLQHFRAAAVVFPNLRQNSIKHCLIQRLQLTLYTLSCYITSRPLIHGSSQMRTDTTHPNSLIY